MEDSLTSWIARCCSSTDAVTSSEAAAFFSLIIAILSMDFIISFLALFTYSTPSVMSPIIEMIFSTANLISLKDDSVTMTESFCWLTMTWVFCISSLTKFVSLSIPFKVVRTSSVATDVWSASFRTSSATTANPLPCSPARAASIDAFKASRLVCSEISVMVPTIPSISRTFTIKLAKTDRIFWISIEDSCDLSFKLAILTIPSSFDFCICCDASNINSFLSCNPSICWANSVAVRFVSSASDACFTAPIETSLIALTISSP